MATRRVFPIALFLALASAAAPALASAQSYRVIELGIPSSPTPAPADINNQRHVVVGRVTLFGSGYGDAFTWDPVHGARPLGVLTFGPVHINDLGVVAGVHAMGGGLQPFLWTDGNVSQPLTPPDRIGELRGWTNSGILLMQGARNWAVHNGVIYDLTAMGRTAYAVNDSGMLGGFAGSLPFGATSRPFLRFPDGHVITPWEDSVAVSVIGAGGHFAGTGVLNAYYGTPDGRVTAFPIAVFRTFTSMNRAGDLVGFHGGRFGANSPILYRGGQIHDLNARIDQNACGCSLTAASAINDAGDIVATARFGALAAEYRVVLLEPAVPVAPGGLIFDVTNRVVRLAWHASPGAIEYILQAGTSPGLSNLFNGSIGASPFLITPAPPGRYYVRALARNAMGLSPPSAEVVIDVP